MKTCTKCGLEKDESEFSKDAQRKTGLQARCRICSRLINTAYRKANPEKEKARNAAKLAVQYAKNPEKFKARAAQWFKSNPTRERKSPIFVNSNGVRKLCTVEGCRNVHQGKGLCNAHYLRAKKAEKEFV